jgi:polyhydroxyalkanoate synthesis regulator phasin
MSDKKVLVELVQLIQKGELTTDEAVHLIQSAMEAALKSQAEGLKKLYLSSMLVSTSERVPNEDKG